MNKSEYNQAMPEKQDEQLAQRLKGISSDIKLYVEKRVELLMLNIGEHFSRLAAETTHKSAGILLLGGAFLFLLIALALVLGDLLNNLSLGFVLVSVPLLVIGGMFVYLRPKSVYKKIRNHFEKELINAISPGNNDQKETLNLPERREQKEN